MARKPDVRIHKHIEESMAFPWQPGIIKTSDSPSRQISLLKTKHKQRFKYTSKFSVTCRWIPYHIIAVNSLLTINVVVCMSEIIELNLYKLYSIRKYLEIKYNMSVNINFLGIYWHLKLFVIHLTMVTMYYFVLWK